MTISKLSNTVQRKILENLRNNVDADEKLALSIKNKNAAQKSGAGKKPFEFDVDVTRIITDNRQVGFISQRGLDLLNKRFIDAKNQHNILITKTQEDFIKKSTPAMREYFRSQQTANKTFQQIINEIIDSVSSIFTRPDLLSDFEKFLTQSTNPKIKKAVSSIPGTPGVLLIQQLKHRELNELFDIFLRDKILPNTEHYLADFILKNTDAGHVLGIFNQKIIRAFGLNITYPNSGPSLPGRVEAELFRGAVSGSDEEKINIIFTKILQLIANADLISSGLLGNTEIFSQTVKIVYDDSTPGKEGTVVEEIQISEDNREIGRKLTLAGAQLSNLIKLAKTASNENIPGSTAQQLRIPGTFGTTLDTFFQKFEDVAKYIAALGQQYSSDKYGMDEAVVQQLVQDSANIAQYLSESEGSPSLVRAPLIVLQSILEGKSLPKKQVSRVKNKVDTKNNKSKKQSLKVPAIKNTTQKSKSINSIKTANFRALATKNQTNLDSLLIQINGNLQEQIRKNMGTGDRRDVLNYRTGRFAESAKVERLSESRQGMITAFYSYMKNPYATFSRGGAQDRPYTRDPKTLISKSIRELAGPLVSNRMRAVLV